MAAKACSVLITGANRGLGLEMVKQMVGSPRPVHQLFACCRDPDGPRADGLRDLAKKHPNVITVIRLDATDHCSIKESAKQVGSLVGKAGLNLLVNNAGGLSHGNMQTTSTQDMQAAFNTNIMGPMNVTKEFLPYLHAAATANGKPGMSCSKAAVVSSSSTVASMATVKELYPFFPAISYRISRAGLNMLTLCATEEFRKDEILFAVLHPAWVRTDMGGEEGAIDAPESVEGLLRMMDSLTEKQSGAFLDYEGKVLPW
ncbi:C-factor-like [Coregonus clupeaformis]|uniref:C-factor-like n=1 Tax=Coregonus clupeaformis TaxID=59861 RepID=UPI001BE03CAE|nr:C-factor-like [Coregonus clupeaformis]